MKRITRGGRRLWRTAFRTIQPSVVAAVIAAILALPGIVSPAFAAGPIMLAKEARVVFDDTFANNRNRWGIQNTADVVATVRDGHYVIDHKRPGASWISLTFVNVRGNQSREIEAVITRTGGADNHGFGLVFNFKNWSDYEYFVITASGRFKHGAVRGNIIQDLVPWTWNNYILTGDVQNVLKIRESAGTRELFVNGERIATVQYSSPLRPRLGFIVFGRQAIEIDRLTVIHDLPVSRMPASGSKPRQ